MRAVLRAIPLTGVAAFWLVSLTSDVAVAQPGCVTGFSPATLSIPAAGAPPGNPVTINVLTSSSNCQWTFEGIFFSNMAPIPQVPPWIGLPSPLSGTGPVTVSLTFFENNASAPRNFILRFGGQPLAVSQAPNPCPLTLSAVSPALIPANGGTGSFTVSTTGSPCSYNVLPTDGVTVTSGGSGSTFPATVTFSVVPNTTQQPVGRNIYVSSFVTFSFAPGVAITQNGSPVATDAPFNGHLFAIHRPGSGAAHMSPPEPIRITNTENPAATWTASPSEPWLMLSPAAGTSPSTATISIDPAGAGVLSRGTYEGTINITSSAAPSTPMSIRVQLRITDATSTTTAPLGVLDIPRPGATALSGAVAVSGWAIDDVGIARVLIYRNSVAGEPQGEVLLGEGTRVRGARPDILGVAFNPGVTSAGWGLMVLSNVLPNGGNGTFVLSAYAEDIEGGRQRLGQTTVTFDNTGSPYPFGTIDVPGQGATVSGMLNNQGWVLAQPGRSIPFDGSTIRLFIDGAERSNLAGYGFARPDVAALFPFPTYPNANGPAAQFTLDTTQFADGMRTIVWVVRDDQNVVQGIGSRYIRVNNGAASQVTAPLAAEARSAATVQRIPQSTALLWQRHGLDEGSWSLRFAGGATHEIRQARGERVEVALDTWWWSEGCGPYAAYLMTGDVAGPLPPGASLDGEESLFRWLPPIEFSGAYEFAFVRKSCLGREERIPLRVILEPR